MTEDQSEADTMEQGAGKLRALRQIGFGVAVVLALAIALYYPIGALLIEAIDDNAEFAAPAPPSGGSRAVAMAAALIEREVDTHHWAASDPFFLPGWALDNMPQFQMGVVGALSRVIETFADKAARAPQAKRPDPDLDRAAGLLKYPGTTWIVDIGAGFSPTASAEAQYRTARKALLAYNDRLAAKQASFERRNDTLLALLERIAADLDATAQGIDRQVSQSSGNLLDFAADDVFYAAKGRLYAHFLMLRELGRDYETVLAERAAAPQWERMAQALREAATLHPWVVFNGAPDSILMPSHLAAQGFYLLAARARMAAVMDALRK